MTRWCRRTQIIGTLALVLVAGCDKATATPMDLGTETVTDESGEVTVTIKALPRPDTESELQFTLKAVGTEEMDKIALDVALDEMWLVEGGAQWSGFVPPRQPQSHRVVVKPLDDAAAPRVRVTVSRFRDSEVLMLREIEFSPDGTVVPD
jgi:hypothetical protein